MKSDVAVFDMLTSTFDEVNNAIQVLKTQDYEDEKTLILISSVVTWVNTPPNRKPGRQVEESTDTESEAGQEPHVDNSGLDEAGEMIYPFEESDLKQRIPSPKYQHFKILENKALAAMKNKENLKVYVLCAGVLYGNGEETLFPHFQQAWLQKSPSLPIIGTGDNIIPTIHVKDLSNMVKRIAQVKPEHHYVFAIDKSLNQTQTELVQTISKCVGSGKTHNIELDDVVYEDWAEFLSLNLRMSVSSIYEELILDQVEEDETKEFPWHCEHGLRENAYKVNEEFNLFRGLQPIKIYVNGPPASGKSHYGAKLSELYNLPHITISDIAKLAETLEGPLGDEIREYIQNKRTEIMEEYDKAKKKGPEPSMDVRLEDKHIYELAKIKLKENSCRNRGFILDGFPKTYIDCYHTFYYKKVEYDEHGNVVTEEKPKQTEGEGEQEPPAEDDQAEKPIDWENDYEIDEAILPKLFIQLSGDTEFIKNRVKELPEEKTTGTHWNDADIDRRTATYNQHNKREEGEEDKKIIEDFFKQHNIPIITQDCQEEGEKVVENLKEAVTSNFTIPKIEPEQKESDKEILQRHLEKADQEPEEEAKEDEHEKTQEEEKAEEIKAKSRLDKIKEHERELLDLRSQPIRQYLMDKVVPLLTEGLIKICKEMPEKPTGKLAEFLNQRCDEIEQEEKEQAANT